MPKPLDVVLGQSERKPWTITAYYEVEIEVWAHDREDAVRRAEKELPYCMSDGDGPYARTADRGRIEAFLKDD